MAVDTVVAQAIQSVRTYPKSGVAWGLSLEPVGFILHQFSVVEILAGPQKVSEMVGARALAIVKQERPNDSITISGILDRASITLNGDDLRFITEVCDDVRATIIVALKESVY